MSASVRSSPAENAGNSAIGDLTSNERGTNPVPELLAIDMRIGDDADDEAEEAAAVGAIGMRELIAARRYGAPAFTTFLDKMSSTCSEKNHVK